MAGVEADGHVRPIHGLKQLGRLSDGGGHCPGAAGGELQQDLGTVTSGDGPDRGDGPLQGRRAFPGPPGARVDHQAVGSDGSGRGALRRGQVGRPAMETGMM